MALLRLKVDSNAHIFRIRPNPLAGLRPTRFRVILACLASLNAKAFSDVPAVARILCVGV